jgi:hypothetical protein
METAFTMQHADKIDFMAAGDGETAGNEITISL